MKFGVYIVETPTSPLLPSFPYSQILADVPLVWPYGPIKIGLFFHGGDGPMTIAAEPLNDEPLSRAMAAVAEVMTVNFLRAHLGVQDLHNLSFAVMGVWHSLWHPDRAPTLTVEHTHRGIIGPQRRRRPRRDRVITCAQYRAMSKKQKKRALAQRRENRK